METDNKQNNDSSLFSFTSSAFSSLKNDFTEFANELYVENKDLISSISGYLDSSNQEQFNESKIATNYGWAWNTLNALRNNLSSAGDWVFKDTIWLLGLDENAIEEEYIKHSSDSNSTPSSYEETIFTNDPSPIVQYISFRDSLDIESESFKRRIVSISQNLPILEESSKTLIQPNGPVTLRDFWARFLFRIRSEWKNKNQDSISPQEENFNLQDNKNNENEKHSDNPERTSDIDKTEETSITEISPYPNSSPMSDWEPINGKGDWLEWE